MDTTPSDLPNPTEGKTPAQPPVAVSSLPARHNKGRLLVMVSIVLALFAMGAVIYTTRTQKMLKEVPTASTQQPAAAATSQKTATSAAAASHAPDRTKLPLGNNKYTTSPKKGYVYTCQTSFNGSGAFRQGPWINTSAGTWDSTHKVVVDGTVNWPQAVWNAANGGQTRTITSRDVPVGHTTGTFPISSSDDAYSYDRNPNSIKTQTISFELTANPVIASSAHCVGGEVGIATTGVLIFDAFDAGGRDAVATEIQDSCEGHPQEGSYYHYHGYSECFKDTAAAGEHSALLGYAFDGFGIYGLNGEDGKELSSADLDECHGHTHQITWDGKTVTMYHYHFTHDFPYTVGCFRGTPSVMALSQGGQQMGRPPAQQ